MAKYAVLGPDGRVTAFYDSTINAVPSGAIPISDSLWRSWISQTGAVIYDAATQSLAPYVAPPLPVEQLLAYAQAKQAAVAAGGVTINLGTSAAPLNISVDTSASGRADLNGLVQMAGIASSFSTTWYQSSGAVTLTAAQIIALGEAVLAWVASTYAALAAVQAQINAMPPTITTTAQIDAFAWPANS